MQQKFDIATIREISIPDALKDQNNTKRDGYPMTTAYRIVVSFSGGSELTDEEIALLAKIPNESMREIMRENILKNRPRVQYSGVFNAEDCITNSDGSPFTTPEDGYTIAEQEKVLQSVRAVYESMGMQNIFTVCTESVEALLNGTDYEGTKAVAYEDDSGNVRELSEQSRLYFGIMQDADAALRAMRRSLLARLNDGSLDASAGPRKKTTTPRLSL